LQRGQTPFARIRLKIKIEIGLEFNQSEERKPISNELCFAEFLYRLYLLQHVPIYSITLRIL